MAANLFRVILPVEDLERADTFWDRILGLPIDQGVPSRHYIQTGGAILVLVDASEHGGRHTPNPEWLYVRVPVGAVTGKTRLRPGSRGKRDANWTPWGPRNPVSPGEARGGGKLKY